MKKTNSKPKIVPLADRVLIRPFRETEEVNVGKVKIVLPESASKEKSDRGVVVAVGEGRFEEGKLIAPRMKVGDTVIFSKYGYDEVKLEDEELYLVKEDNILAIIK
jgi:chaperonin GroES